MQRFTAITIMTNLAHTIRLHLWEYHQNEQKVVFFSDLHLGDPILMSTSAAIIKSRERIDCFIIPAAEDVIESTKGAYGSDAEYNLEREMLIGVIKKWNAIIGATEQVGS